MIAAWRKTTVTCPDCGESRQINLASSQCQAFTGLCMRCARARAYVKKTPTPDVSGRKQFCLNAECNKQIPVNKHLRFCEACRLRNSRMSEEEVYGQPVSVKVGYSIW